MTKRMQVLLSLFAFVAIMAAGGIYFNQKQLSASADTMGTYSTLAHHHGSATTKPVNTFNSLAHNHSSGVGPVYYRSVTATASAGGTISPSGVTRPASLTSPVFTIKANDGYKIADVKVDGKTVGAVSTYTFNSISADHEITASFEINSVAVSGSIIDQFSKKPIDGIVIKKYFAPNTKTAGMPAINLAPLGATDKNGNYTVNVGPAGSYKLEFSDKNSGYNPLIVDVKIVGTTALKDKNYQLVPIVKYSITSSATKGGTISPLGVTTVISGKGQDYKIVADKGYKIGEVKVDNKVITLATSGIYSFVGVNSNRTIAVSFVAPFTIISSATAGGVISPSGNVNVDAGRMQRFIVTPNKGYKLSDLKVDGRSVGAMTDYTIPNITANHTIAATFALSAQLGSALGKVVKMDNQPAIGATVSVTKLGNPTVIQTLTTDNNGSYNATGLTDGNYMASVKLRQCTKYWFVSLCNNVAGFAQFGSVGGRNGIIQTITVR